MRRRAVQSNLAFSASLARGRHAMLWLAALGLLMGGCNSASYQRDRARRRSERSASQTTLVSLPTIRESKFRNTGPEARYVGNAACGQCHQDQFDSYQTTMHSRALDDVDIAQEPPDGELTHELSGRSYRIYRKDGQLRHREFIRCEDGEELEIADYPMRYVVGSGNHSRTYLIEVDGYLFESPVTWYTSRKAWAMSPGYEDQPTQAGFARPILHGCVICHAGHVETVDGSPQRLKIREQAVSCERCHGPGSLHVELHQRGGAAGDFDDSIVHPGRLPRERQEAICAQCHLATEAQADVRGRTIGDFRPSLHLSDFRVHFQLETEGQEMTVVGHIEQMRASRCYQASPQMTCTTCHDMHSGGVAGGAGRQSCLKCHQVDSCHLEEAERLHQSAADDCTICHMPRSDTDIPHFAFRHHRVGIHPQPGSAPSEPPAEQSAALQEPAKELANKLVKKLVPIDDIDHLPELERQRCLGIAYVQLAESSELDNPKLYFMRAQEILKQVRQQGVRDAELDATLARTYLHLGDDRRTIMMGREALYFGRFTCAETRQDVDGAMSRAYANLNDYELALPFLEELSRLRYVAEDLLMLSICRQRQGDLPGAIEAAQRAVNIEPDRPDLHDAVAELYQAQGELSKSQWHRERSQRLRQLLRVVPGEEPDGTRARTLHFAQ